MTRDDILRMAREADLYEGSDDQVIRFAYLVAAAEREKVANWMMQRGYATGHGDTTEDLLSELEWQVREDERDHSSKRLAPQSVNPSEYFLVVERVNDHVFLSFNLASMYRHVSTMPTYSPSAL